MKLIVQRLVKVLIEDIYEVDKITEDIIDKAINYEIDASSSEPLWESQEDLGPIEVYDDDWNVLYSTTTLDNE